MQGFGKRKNYVGMSKPKKRKLEPVETVDLVETNAGIGKDEPYLAHASPPPPSQPAAPPSPGAEKRKAAAEAHKEAALKYAVFQRKLGELLAKEKLAERVHDAKWKRWNAPRRNRKPRKPMAEVCRMYESTIDLHETCLMSARGRMITDEAFADALLAQIDVLKLENSRLRRVVRCAKK